MTLSYEDAVAQLTAPGERFETGEVEVGGITYTAFTAVPESLRDLFDLTRGYAQTPYLVYEDETYTFDETHGLADAVAAALQSRYGVEKGDRVAIAMRNYPEWIATYIGAISIGAIVVSMNAWWTADELEYGLTDSGAKVLVADQERVDRTRDAADRLGLATVGVRLTGEAPEGVDPWTTVVEVGATPERVEIDRKSVV